MTDSLLTEKQKELLIKLISKKSYKDIIAILEKIKTQHAGTAKTKDKRFVIREIVRFILDNSKNKEKDFFITGNIFCNYAEISAKEIGVSLIWRGYKYDTAKVKLQLLRIADNSNWEVREYAGTAFADTLYLNPDFYRDIIKWTKHSSENVRRAVVFSTLGLRNEKDLKKAFAVMEPLMYDDSVYVKKNLGPFILGSYFGNSFPEQTINQLKKWSKIKDANVRWNIIMSFKNSFGNKYPEAALKVIGSFIADENIKVKRAVKSALNHLIKRNKKLVDDFNKKNNLI